MFGMKDFQKEVEKFFTVVDSTREVLMIIHRTFGMTKNYDPLDMSKVGEIRVALVNWLDLLPKNTEFELGGTAITSQAERNLRCIVDDVNYHIKRRKNLEKYINIKDLYTAVGNAKLALSILRSVRKMQERHIRQIRVVRG